MASLSQIFGALLMAALLLFGQAAQAGACFCHSHDEAEEFVCESVAACLSGDHGGHGEEGDGCTCACHDLSNKTSEAVGTGVSVAVPLFVPHPCVSDMFDAVFLQGLERSRPVGPPETVPRHVPHKGFVCPLRS